MNEEQRDRQAELEMAGREARAIAAAREAQRLRNEGARGAGVDVEPVPTRVSEVWSQVGMLEEEIGSIGDAIEELHNSLELAGVLGTDPPVDSREDEPPSCVRLGGVLQNMRLALNRHRECVCVLMARLGV
jgi:hypothetical protein